MILQVPVWMEKMFGQAWIKVRRLGDLTFPVEFSLGCGPSTWMIPPFPQWHSSFLKQNETSSKCIGKFEEIPWNIVHCLGWLYNDPLIYAELKPVFSVSIPKMWDPEPQSSSHHHFYIRRKSQAGPTHFYIPQREEDHPKFCQVILNQNLILELTRHFVWTKKNQNHPKYYSPNLQVTYYCLSKPSCFVKDRCLGIFGFAGINK